jgi:hypothetical protein
MPGMGRRDMHRGKAGDGARQFHVQSGEGKVCGSELVDGKEDGAVSTLVRVPSYNDIRPGWGNGRHILSLWPLRDGSCAHGPARDVDGRGESSHSVVLN